MFRSAASLHFSQLLSPSFRCVTGSTLLTVSFLVARYWLCRGVRGFMCGNSASSMANPVVVPAKASHTASIIFLHGLGDTGHGWLAGLEEVVNTQHIKIICPTAPTIPVTLNAMLRMPAWFDIESLSFDEDQDEDRIVASSQMLSSLIDEEEKNGIPSNRIVIGGFSQGGAVALYTALTTERQLGGVLALSTWLPLHTKFPKRFAGSTREYPLLQCHGEADPVVNMKYGEMTRAILDKFFKEKMFLRYPNCGHSSCPKEMKDVRDFLTKVLPTGTSSI